MLESFRKLSKTLVFKTFMGLLLLAFVLSGVNGLSSMSFTEDYLVKVGKERITQYAVDNKYDQTVRNIRRSGLDFSDEQLAGMGISKPQILRNMVQESLIRQEVQDLGIEAGDDAVAQQIKSIPQFQTNGKFDREKYNYVVAGLGLRESQFTQSLREEIKNNMLMSTVVSSIPTNNYIVKQQAAHYGEKRDIEIAIVPKTLNIEVATPDDEELKSYYFENSVQFQIPEERELRYFTFKKDSKNDSELYDFTVKIEDELAAGSTINEIAQKLNLKVQTKSDVKKDNSELSDLLLETAFDKKESEISDLVFDETNNEYFVVEVTKIKKAHIPELAQVKDKVLAAWKDERSNDANLKYIEEQSNELRESKESLKDFAQRQGYKYQVIKNVERHDTEQHGVRLVTDAFAVDEGEVIGSFQNEDGTYKIAKLLDIRQEKLTTEEEEKYKAEVADQMKIEIMDQYFEALRKKFPVKQKAQPVKVSADDQSVPVPPKK